MQNHFQKPQPLVSPEQRLPGVPPSLREFVAESVASIRNSRWQTVKPSSYVASRAKYASQPNPAGRTTTQNKARQDLYGDADNSIAKRVMRSILPSDSWKRPW